ncbi:MAG TPA: tetratricopeptide repeat protein [Bacteroidetes bacterium]|nr:tetratricopeptide repeat protein [Bacteroidota bacterium]
MDKNQWIVIIAAAVLFFTLYFGCDTRPGEYDDIEKKRVENREITSVRSLLMDAKKDLLPAEAASLTALEMELEEAPDDSIRAMALQQLSGAWYRLGQYALAGHYAEQVAQLKNNEEAWSIAGTTYSICVQKEKEPKTRQYCTEHGLVALENAISINPSNLQHQINRALIYTENPPADNPMKGILMLVNLNKEHPENVAVLNQLGRLGIKTGQYEKAIGRLKKAIGLEPDNPVSNCLLGRALQETGRHNEAEKYLARCQIHNSD